MALSRISDLTAGTVPIIGTSLFEVSVPNAGAPSGYDSRKFTLTNVLSTAVAKAGDTMTGGLLVNGTITQGVTNPNASFQGIASISSAYNEIAVYGAGAGAGAPYCAMSADNINGYLYAGNNANLHIETKGASGAISFDTGATTTTRMIINASGNTNVYTTFAVCKADGSTYFTLYDDGNSHIDSTTALWLNANGKSLTIGGPTTISGKVTVQLPDDPGYQMLVGGTIVAARVFTQTNKAMIEGVLPNLTAFCPLWVGGSTLALHTGNITRMSIDANGNTTFNGFVKIAFPDAGAAQLLVSGTTYAMRIYTTPTFAELSAVTPAVSGLVPLRLSGSTVEIATSQITMNGKVIIQSDTNQLWIKSLNNTIQANLVMECVGIHIYSIGVGTSGTWMLYDNNANRPCLTVSTLGDLNVQHDITAGNTLFANNWVYLFGGLKCRNNANTTWLDIYDDGNTHLESSTQLWLNSNSKPTLVGGALTTHAVTSTITGQTTANIDTNGPINLILDDVGSVAGSGGGLIFSGSTGERKFAAIKGYVTDGTANSRGCLYITTRRLPDDTVLTTTAMFSETGTCYNTTGSWSVFSDRSLKQDVEPYERGLDAIVKLSPVQFRYQPGTLFTTEDAPSRLLYGLLADEVFPHIPEVCDSLDLHIDDNIDGEKRTIATLNPTDLVYCLINAVKELHAEIENIKSSLN
jgi:hypothetical protein